VGLRWLGWDAGERIVEGSDKIALLVTGEDKGGRVPMRGNGRSGM
jgi:hypothetical protein